MLFCTHKGKDEKDAWLTHTDFQDFRSFSSFPFFPFPGCGGGKPKNAFLEYLLESGGGLKKLFAAKIKRNTELHFRLES